MCLPSSPLCAWASLQWPSGSQQIEISAPWSPGRSQGSIVGVIANIGGALCIGNRADLSAYINLNNSLCGKCFCAQFADEDTEAPGAAPLV